MTDRIDRRSFLARGAATGAGVAVVGASGGRPGRLQLGIELRLELGLGTRPTGSHPDGVSTATPKKGGSLIFGVDAEEKGFSPTQGTFDEVGIIYARTVFDPLMILERRRRPPALPGPVGHPQHRLHRVDHHHATQPDVPQRRPVRRRRRGRQLQRPQGVRPHRAGPHHRAASVTVTSPLVVTVTMKSPWVPFDYYLTGGIGGQFAFIAEPTWLASRQPDQPGGHRALRLPGVEPERPLHRHQEPPLLAAGPPLPRLHHLQADPRHRTAPGQPDLGRDRHHALRHARGDHPAPGRHLPRLHRRLQERGRRAGHGLHPPQPVQAALQQPEGAPGHGLRRQLGPVRDRSSTRG